MYMNVESARAYYNMTLEELAKMIGCSTSTMSAKLSGKVVITLEEAIKIKQVLKSELSLEELFRQREETDESD